MKLLENDSLERIVRRGDAPSSWLKWKRLSTGPTSIFQIWRYWLRTMSTSQDENFWMRVWLSESILFQVSSSLSSIGTSIFSSCKRVSESASEVVLVYVRSSLSRAPKY